MRRNSERQKRKTTHYSVWIMRLAAVIGCLTLISVYLLSGAYSKFYTSALGSDTARVAKFSPDFTATEIIIENELPGFPNIPNNSYEIPFSVQNFSDDTPAEVAMKYKIVLKITGTIPLKFNLLNSAGTNTLQTWECNGTSGECVYEYTDSSLVFGVGTKETDSYKLKIEWSSDKKDAEFSGMTDAVYLEAVFEQID